MRDETQLKKEYEAKGYRDLGSVNTKLDTARAVQNSKDKEWIKIGRNYDLVVCHDIKAFATIDSGD